MFALADCNNFFASCERVFRPELNGRPVIVLSNNDGCAVARSNEAKALGIKMGAPLFQIQDIVERHHVAVFSSNFALYGDMSRRVQEVLREFAPSVEQYSIDEAFLDLRGMRIEDPDALAKEISRECRRKTAIPVSVGIAPTKTLAKIASKLCKQYPKLRGGCYMHRPQDIEKVLKKFPAQDVWGIGRRSVKKLASMNVYTAWDYVKLPEIAVRKQFALPGYRTWLELQGQPCIEFEDMIEPRQSICVSRSFAKEITDPSVLCEQVANFAEGAADKLRAQKSMAVEMAVFAFTNRFKENSPQTYGSRMVVFPDATDEHRAIVSAAVKAARELYSPGYGYKKAGVVITKLIQKEEHMRSLFADTASEQRESRLSDSIDTINRSFGRGAILFGVQGDGRIRLSREHQSPHYTTLWSDIPKASVK
ncbi:MAG: Y-family DNA polymerase [Bacteroidales bacterium]|nr:Y-family DNA polymerase [Bacteroidales bacterium]